jgi:hypothetical protein
MRIDVRGAIRNGKGWKSVTGADGKPVSKREAVAWLLDRLSEGKSYLPFGDCDNFDYVKGDCRGHDELPGSPHPTTDGGPGK